MKLTVDPEAREDLRRIDEEIQQQISDAIDGLANDPLPENSYVIHLPDGTEIQCLKLQEEDRNSRLNHRVTYDILEDAEIRVYGIFPRGPGYPRIKEKTGKRRD